MNIKPGCRFISLSQQEFGRALWNDKFKVYIYRHGDERLPVESCLGVATGDDTVSTTEVVTSTVRRTE